MQPEMVPMDFYEKFAWNLMAGNEFALWRFLPTADAGHGNNLSAATSLGRTE